MSVVCRTWEMVSSVYLLVRLANWSGSVLLGIDAVMFSLMSHSNTFMTTEMSARGR